MDGFKMACIFAKVEFVRYVSNMCTILVTLNLSCIRGYDRVVVELYVLGGHKYEATPVITMRRLGGWFGWRRGCGISRMPV
jgi:hypothetical protein